MKNKYSKYALIGLSTSASLAALPLIYLVNQNLEQKNSTTQLNSNQEVQKPKDLNEWRSGRTDQNNINKWSKLSKFDARDYNVVTPVKRQYENICWAYSLIAASETSMLLKGDVIENATDQTLDLSEDNVSYIINRRDKTADKLGLTWEDLKDRSTFQGFNLLNGAQVMFQQNTPIDGKDNWSVVGNPVAHTDNVIKLKNDDRDMIKKAVLEFGGVSFGYGMSYASHYANQDYYNNTQLNGNYEFFHAATIVGWDDTLSKELWGDQNVKQNGGWIVKQSWGTGFGTNGYYYMSYDALLQDVLVLDYSKKGKYENNYYYDGDVDFSRHREGINEVSAIFPVKRASYNRNEYVQAINVGIIGENVTVEAKVYTGVQKVYPGHRFSVDNDPTSGTLATTKKVKFANPGSYGIYTIDFGQEIEIKPGEFFSIVVNVTNEKGDAAVMFSIEDSTNDMTFYKDKNKNRWANSGDLADGYVARIKALTTTKVNQNSSDNDLLYSTINIDKTKVRYKSDEAKPKPVVTFDNQTLTEGTDYQIEYQETYQIPEFNITNDTVVGSGKITIKGIGKYKGQASAYYSILLGIKPVINFGTYDDNNYSPTILIQTSTANKYSDIYLPDGWSWTGGSEDPISEGQNTGKYLEYRGSDAKYYSKKTFQAIVTKTSGGSSSKIDLSSANVTINGGSSWTYDGKPKQPEVTVTLNNTTLSKDRDYGLTYQNNINVGTATIIISGVNSYQGRKEITFEIKKMMVQISVEVDQNGNVVIKAPNVDNIADMKPTYKYYADRECTQELPEKPTTPGTYYVKTIINSTNHEITNQDALVKEFTISANPGGGDNPNPDPNPNPDVNNNHGSNTAMVIALSTIIPTLGLSGIAYLIYRIIKKKRG